MEHKTFTGYQENIIDMEINHWFSEIGKITIVDKNVFATHNKNGSLEIVISFVYERKV